MSKGQKNWQANFSAKNSASVSPLINADLSELIISIISDGTGRKSNDVSALTIFKEANQKVLRPSYSIHNLYEEISARILLLLDDTLSPYKHQLTKNLLKVGEKLEAPGGEQAQNFSYASLSLFYIICKLGELISASGINLLDEALKGAHIIVNDNGVLYETMKTLGGKRRISSHHSNNKEENSPDLGIGDDLVLNEVLFGKTKDGKTWFQVEAHSTRGLINFLAHIIDYILYKATGRNVSQYGYSKHRDNNPIEINFIHSKASSLNIASPLQLAR